MAITKTVYVDPAAADGGNGTFATPYNLLSAGVTAANADESRLRLRRGRVYMLESGRDSVLQLVNTRPAGLLLIDSYGDGDPPILFGGLYMPPGDSGWEYRGYGVWRKALPVNAGGANPATFRLYLGAAITGAAANKSPGSAVKYGVAAARCAVASTASEAVILGNINSVSRADIQNRRLWMYTQKSDGVTFDGYLYVYTGSASIDPAVYYDGLVLVGSNGLTDANRLGAVYGVNLYKAQRCIIKELDCAYAAIGLSIGCDTISALDIDISGCRSLAYGTRGVRIVGFTGAPAERGVVHDTLVDAVATFAEDWTYRDKDAIEWLNGTQDGCTIGGHTVDCRLEGVSSRDAYHGNFVIGNADNTSQAVRAMVVDCKTNSSNRSYGYCFVGLSYGAGNLATVDRFVGGDSTNWIHKTGTGVTRFRDCAFTQCTRPTSAYDHTGGYNLGANTIPGISVFPTPSAGSLEAGAVTAERCTFTNPYGWLIEVVGVYYATSNLAPTGAVDLTDCVLMDTAYINNPSARSFGVGIERPGVSINLTQDGGNSGVISMANTTVYTGTVGQSIVATADRLTPTLVTLASGVSGTPSEVNPQVDSQSRPLTGSPLIGAVATNGLTRDAAGMYRDTASTRGAFEYVRPRPTRTLP